MNRFSHLAKGPAIVVGCSVLLTLAACEDLTGVGPGLGPTNRSVTLDTQPRPKPDSRGVISYPNYQVVVAKRGDSIAALADRVGLRGEDLAKHNGLPMDYILRDGELLVLPSRVAAGSGLDIASIASAAIDNAGPTSGTTPPTSGSAQEPLRHRVEHGETAYSIARLYDVSVTSLASWNGLGANLAVREGQQLLIPLADSSADRVATVSKPGDGSVTPTPPSASEPLPDETSAARTPESPDLGQFRSDTSGERKFLTPVQGKIISPYSGKSGGNEGIDIAAVPGTAVKAAEDGEVALISKSVGENTIVLLRHSGNIYTVYSNVSGVNVTKGQKIKRGQKIGAVLKGSPSYLHFEVRRGTESVDPAPFL